MYDGVVEALQKRQDASMGAHGTVINVVSWLLTVIALCTLVARFAMKFCIKDKSRRFGLDDLFIILAAIFSIGQTIAVSIEAIQVLGQHFVDLDQHQKITMQKAEYASCILYLANMGSARISLCLLIKKILPGTIARYTALVFVGFTALWTISGILVTAFPCKLPHPWIFSNPSACINLVSWVNYLGITNIVVEILLVLIPLVIWNLRTSVGKTTSVSLMFLTRLSIVGAVAAQLHFYNRYTSQYYVDIYQYWRTVLCVQIAQNLSIITASLPCLHPFIIKVLAGTVNTDELRFDCEREARQIFFGKGKVIFDPTSSHSSGLPINEKKEPISYCAPLATYGLDRSSAHLNSQHFNRFPSNVATPVSENDEPFQNIFMAPVEVAPSRPPTSHSTTSGTSVASPAQIPNTLAEVGCLPVIDWDTESSDRDSGRSTPSRRRNSEYVFNRSKVISVPEESHLKDAEGAYCKKYHPPLPSPKMPKRPPRNF